MLRNQCQFRKLSAWLLFGLLLTGCADENADPVVEPDPIVEPDPGKPVTEDPVIPDVPVKNNISLNWGIPTARKDGSLISPSDIAGYKLHYGIAPGVYDKTIDVGLVSSYTLSSMPATTYYITVSVYDTNSVDSDLSNEQVATVN